MCKLRSGCLPDCKSWQAVLPVLLLCPPPGPTPPYSNARHFLLHPSDQGARTDTGRDGSHRTKGNTRGHKGLPLQRRAGVKTPNSQESKITGWKWSLRVINSRLVSNSLTLHVTAGTYGPPSLASGEHTPEPRAFQLSQELGSSPAVAIPRPLSAPGAGRGEGKTSGKSSRRTTKRSSRNQSPKPAG